MVDGPLVPISAEEGFGGVPKDTTDYFDPLEFARPSFEAAKERFMDAGKIDVNPEDPALYTAFKRSMDYLADTGMAGLELSDAAFKAAVGTIAELVPGQSQEQEKRLERDLYSMPEAFMGNPLRALSKIGHAAKAVSSTLKQKGPEFVFDETGSLTIIGGDKVTNLSKAREDKKLKEFYSKLQDEIKSKVKTISEATSVAKERGVFDGFNVGDRFLTKNGPIKVEGVFLRELKLKDTLAKMAFERFGVKPETISFNKKEYLPMVRVSRGVEGSEDYMSSDSYLQLMKESNYPRMGDLKPTFAEGGSVEKQMSRMYQEGGLQDDGARIEPVTGNEVPTGSMDQEVRDNISTELEEGSYVVPADVARYYGRKFFEDLIKSAK